MTAHIRVPVQARRRRTSGFIAPAQKVFELWMAVPAVVAMRTARMVAAGPVPNAADQVEFARMGSEKAHAFGASFAAMAAQGQRAHADWYATFVKAWWSMCMKPWWLGPAHVLPGKRQQRAWSRQYLADTAAMLDHGLAPLHKAATENARRLSRIAHR